MASLRTLSLACALVAVSISAEARTRHHRVVDDGSSAVDRHDVRGGYETATVLRVRSGRHYSRARGAGGSSSLADTLRENVRLVRQQADEIDKMRRELAEIRQQISPNAAMVLPAPQNNSVVVASASALPQDDPTYIEKKPAPAPIHVFPATAVQRGQFNDRRRTHRHAGIDLSGQYGSSIVASFAGVVLPPPGGDRGYGPHCLVVRGDDGIVYRYAHLSSVSVNIGERVAAGQRLGGMGHVGRHGRDHLHFEMIPVAEYRRRPYGVHKLDPNDYLGGGRGKSMIAGNAMTGDAARTYASRHAPSKVADAP